MIKLTDQLWLIFQVATLEKDLEMKNMTEAQSRTIPVLLEKKDALVKSQTGSGKTLAYAIPIVEVCRFLFYTKVWQTG